MKKVYLSSFGEIIIKDGTTVWIWHSEFNGPIIATDDYLSEQHLIEITSSKDVERKVKWKKYRSKVKKYFKED